MASDSDSGWETTSSSKSDPELKEVKKYGKTLKRDREKALEESNSKVEEPKKPSAPKEMDLDCEQLDKRIRDDPDIKLGFVIYRTTYKSQEDWDRFMAHVKERIRLNFEGDGAAHLYDRIEWCVQDDPALARASSTKVRRRFKKWIRECGEKDHWMGSARFKACVMIDSQSLKRVLKGVPPSEFDADQFDAIRLVSVDKDEDEMFVGLSYLMPRFYCLLEVCGWDNFAPREGEYVARP